MLPRMSYAALVVLVAAWPAAATPPPPPTGEVHIGRLGTSCDGVYADGRRFRDYSLSAAPGQEYGLVIASNEMDAALLVLESADSKTALLSLAGTKGHPAAARFRASADSPAARQVHRYVLRVQALSGQLGTFKVEANYDGKAAETYFPGVDPAVLYAALNPASKTTPSGCRSVR